MARKLDPEKRTAILEAARKLFKEKGAGETSMSEIAAAAGLAKGSVYVYFKGKMDIVRALCDSYFLGLTKTVRPCMQNPDISKAISDSVHAAFDYGSRNSDMVSLVDVLLSYSGRTNSPQVNSESGYAVDEWLKQRVDGASYVNLDPMVRAEIYGAILQWFFRRCFVLLNADRGRYEDQVIKLFTFMITGKP